MTEYGTIPPSASGSTSAEYVSRAKARIKERLDTRRPWQIMFNFHSMSLPPKLPEALLRLRTNIAYFEMNYAIIILVILFLSLLWHPISMIVYIVMMAAWLFLYFLRDEQLVVSGRPIDDRVVLVVLGTLTIVFLLLSGVSLNVVVSLLIGVAVVAVHGVVRKTDDLFLDEESTGLITPAASSSS